MENFTENYFPKVPAILSADEEMNLSSSNTEELLLEKMQMTRAPKRAWASYNQTLCDVPIDFELNFQFQGIGHLLWAPHWPKFNKKTYIDNCGWSASINLKKKMRINNFGIENQGVKFLILKTEGNSFKKRG